MRATSLPSLLALLALAGCSAHGVDLNGYGDGGGQPPLGSGDAGGTLGGDGGGGSAPTGKTLLYAHTDTTLYQLDPDNITAPMMLLGDFDCISSGGYGGYGGSGGGASSMTDFGVTKDGRLFGVSEGAAYPLSAQGGGVVHCGSTWTLPNTKFYGLTIAPENTLGAQEVLVGADGQGGLYEIDQNSGTPTQVGTLGTDPQSGQPWSLSGDIVFLANGGSPLGFATVRTCGSGGSSCSSTDTLIEVDLTAIHPGTQSVLKAVRGALVTGSWCTNPSSPPSFGSVFGIAAYQDTVYGFSHTGQIIEIHNDDGSACLVSTIANQKFAGAGVTTSAPVKAPPPK